MIEHKPCVVITGASTGIGRSCAMWLGTRGWRAFAGVRKQHDADSIREEARAKSAVVETVTIDVADDASITAAAEDVRARLGGAPLLGLVNNAGIGVVGPVEFVPRDEWRRQFEVNLFGQIAATQALLPLLRAGVAARGAWSSRIVMMSSIAGRMSQPILSPYCASKHALEAVGDALRLELRAHGIGVSLVEPGAIDTPIWGKGRDAVEQFPPGSHADELYGQAMRGVEAAAMRAAKGAIPTDSVSRAVERCLTARRAPARLIVGRDAKMGAFLRKWLPTKWFDRVIGRHMGIPPALALVRRS